MSPAKHVLSPDMSVDETMSMLLHTGLDGAPVVDDNQELVGVVSSFDFLQKEAFEGALLPMDGSVETVEKYVGAARKICGQKVEDVMTCHPATISQRSSMRDAAATMAELKLHRLPVVNDAGKLVGVLTAADVMKDLLHIVRNLPPANEEEENDSTEKKESAKVSP
jgi:CBS domain-containing protein